MKRKSISPVGIYAFNPKTFKIYFCCQSLLFFTFIFLLVSNFSAYPQTFYVRERLL